MKANRKELVSDTVEEKPCEDCVSREAVMKLKSHKPEYGDMIYAFDVELLPSVTPKQRTGKWVECYNETLNERVLYCDKCRNYVPRGTNYDYCPYCGVKMEGVIDKETMDDLERYFFGDDRGEEG